MKLSELTPFLASIGAFPKKGLSQNFLIDPNITHKIVNTANVGPDDIVLEIGPGAGALTACLLEKGAKVIAIEKDKTLAQALSRLQTPDHRLTIYCEDALEISWENLPYHKIVANLPYHITTPLLEKAFTTKATPVTCMIQKEVADRMGASSGCKMFGSFTIFTQIYMTVQERFIVSSHCFHPKPSVDSVVLHLTPRLEPIQIHPSFFLWMRTSFQQRRKCLKASLQKFFTSEQIQNALASLNLRIDARPEALSIDEWCLFVEKLGRET